MRDATRCSSWAQLPIAGAIDSSPALPASARQRLGEARGRPARSCASMTQRDRETSGAGVEGQRRTATCAPTGARAARRCLMRGCIYAVVVKPHTSCVRRGFSGLGASIDASNLAPVGNVSKQRYKRKRPPGMQREQRLSEKRYPPGRTLTAPKGRLDSRRQDSCITPLLNAALLLLLARAGGAATAICSWHSPPRAQRSGAAVTPQVQRVA